ncbi:unnamed protein product, partial [Discosporangium mesarthrocarpum]
RAPSYSEHVVQAFADRGTITIREFLPSTSPVHKAPQATLEEDREDAAGDKGRATPTKFINSGGGSTSSSLEGRLLDESGQPLPELEAITFPSRVAISPVQPPLEGGGASSGVGVRV